MRETFRRVKAIPTQYRGVPMRSRLEARVAGTLDTLRIPWEYEPRIYWVPGVKNSGYMPDFRLWPGEPHPWFVEIKPTGIYDQRHTDPTDLRNAIERMLRIRHTEPQSTLVLWLADPRADDYGRLLVHVPYASGWVERPALSFLATAVKARRVVTTPRRWWYRFIGR